MTTDESLQKARFIAEYAAHLMGCSVHTSRVVRNTKRIGKALGFKAKVGTLQKGIILTITDRETQRTYSEMMEVPAVPISFEHNSELSALSWEAVDKQLSFEEIKEKYEKIISAPRLKPAIVLTLVAFANASFCRLFGGDWISMIIVLLATAAGYFTRLELMKRKVNNYITFIVSAFTASIVSAGALMFNTTSDIALATSVLFLIPGVPLINGVIDIIEGHTFIGISRLTNAFLLIVCIAIGLSFTLLLVHDRLI